jgi:FMN phosphatase YigB (HAD superfamily)
LEKTQPPPANKRIRAAFFDGDGVILKMPKQHFHEVYAQREGLPPDSFQEFYGPSYNDILRGRGDIKSHIEAHKHIWGDHDPNELVAEWLKYDSQLNQPLLKVIRERRKRDLVASRRDANFPVVGLYLATVQEPIRFNHIKNNLVPGLFDNYYATCELGFLKVEEEDKHPRTQTILEAPKARYFSKILGGLAVAPEQTAFFDDRPDNVEIARRKGINAYIYESPQQVERILSM